MVNNPFRAQTDKSVQQNADDWGKTKFKPIKFGGGNKKPFDKHQRPFYKKKFDNHEGSFHKNKGTSKFNQVARDVKPENSTPWNKYKDEIFYKQQEEEQAALQVNMDGNKAKQALKQREINFRKLLIEQMKQEPTKWEDFDEDVNNSSKNKGHTSFQCQMICKNCSAPYHGYRTCPKPANLNTSMQLFMEFCMQQLQHFDAEKQLSTNRIDSVPKPQIESPSTSVTSKSNKLKRKKIKNLESNVKTKSKKRKLTSRHHNDEDDSETSLAESEEDTIDSDKTSSSSDSLVPSKKKPKVKNKNASKTEFNLPNFATNPLNLPLILNGFPNLTAAASSITNSNTSSNALNTLLLTQMFQNAFGSLKQ